MTRLASAMAGGMDGDTAGRWLSYAELAEVRGTDKHSALKLALRKRWPRRKDNHGIMQVCVPPEWLSEWTRKSDGMSPGTASDMASPMAPARADGVDIGGIIGAFETATVLLTKRAEAAESRADAMQQARDEANKRADVAVALADRTLAQLEEANARADRAELARGRWRASYARQRVRRNTTDAPLWPSLTRRSGRRRSCARPMPIGEGRDDGSGSGWRGGVRDAPKPARISAGRRRPLIAIRRLQMCRKASVPSCSEHSAWAG